jgi:hypothetical protein
MLKKMMKITEMALIAEPNLPIWNGPMGMYLRPVKRFGPKASAYEVEERTMKDPARSEMAVTLLNVMAPRPVVMMPTKIVAGMGQESRSLTLPKRPGNGIALSRAKAHHVRPTVRKVPIRHGHRDKKMMKSRLNVAAWLPVACEYAAASGKEPLLF